VYFGVILNLSSDYKIFLFFQIETILDYSTVTFRTQKLPLCHPESATENWIGGYKIINIISKIIFDRQEVPLSKLSDSFMYFHIV